MPQGLEIGKKYRVTTYDEGDPVVGVCVRIKEDLNGCQHARLHQMAPNPTNGVLAPHMMEVMDVELALADTGEQVERGPSFSEGKLGRKYRDTVSGFEGIAIQRHIYMGNGAQLTLQPPYDHAEHKMPDRYSFDEQQLEEITLQGQSARVPTTATGGGDFERSAHAPG